MTGYYNEEKIIIIASDEITNHLLIARYTDQLKRSSFGYGSEIDVIKVDEKENIAEIEHKIRILRRKFDGFNKYSVHALGRLGTQIAIGMIKDFPEVIKHVFIIGGAPLSAMKSVLKFGYQSRTNIIKKIASQDQSSTQERLFNCWNFPDSFNSGIKVPLREQLIEFNIQLYYLPEKSHDNQLFKKFRKYFKQEKAISVWKEQGAIITDQVYIYHDQENNDLRARSIFNTILSSSKQNSLSLLDF